MAIELIPNYQEYGVNAIPDSTWLTEAKGWTTVPFQLTANLNLKRVLNSLSIGGYSDIVNNEYGYIRYTKVYTNEYSLKIYYNNAQIGSISGSYGSSVNEYMYFGVGIDEATQKGYFAQYTKFDTSSTAKWKCEIPLTLQQDKMYLLLKSTITPQYNWQSVPSISGKNGILSLVTLDSESINDGEPVSGAAVSVFDQNPVSGNNVKDIVDGNTPLIPSAVDVTAAFIISNPPVGELASRILAAKKGSIPESIEDADKTISIPANASNVTMPGLDENSQYYFAIFVADATGDTAVSDPKDIYTSADEGWSFDYTGEIQTFVAPKTGIYQLETWGAQGGDATDGTLTARGGYGAYAGGEIYLYEGDKLYINVGGQNGYGGGGNMIIRGANIIENNTYNPDVTPQGIDISSNVAVYAIPSGSGSWQSVNTELSEYLLSNKTLILYMSGNVRYSLTEDGIFRRTSNRAFMGVHTFIPVTRINNPQTLKFKHKDYSRYGSYFQGEIGAGYVKNGEYIMTSHLYGLDLNSTTVSDWAEKSFDISDMPYIDYIYFAWYDGCEDFKDFIIEYI